MNVSLRKIESIEREYRLDFYEIEFFPKKKKFLFNLSKKENYKGEASKRRRKKLLVTQNSKQIIQKIIK